MVSPNKKPHRRPPRTNRRRHASDNASKGNASKGNASKGSFGLRRPRESSSRNATTSNNNNNSNTNQKPTQVELSNSNYPLIRDDLSDLSGSNYGNTQQGGAQVVQPDNSNKSWRHAKILSDGRLPKFPQPPADDESSVRHKFVTTVQQGEVIEIAVSHHNRRNVNSNNDACRTPILIVLMDPKPKKYELMQMWIDTETDSIREVLLTVQRNLEGWKQDYDGLFQVRNNHFSQLIHIMKSANYDICPYEVFVGKPWSMSAKHSVGYASTLLNHLKQIGVLSYKKTSDFNKSFFLRKKKHHADDSVLVLSKKALQRVYVPQGILKHHHAVQILNFTSPFETLVIDVLSGDDGLSSSGLSSSDLTDSSVDNNNNNHAVQRSSLLLLGNDDDESDVQSETESTHSTTGTHSPLRRRRQQPRQSYSSTAADASASGSVATRASAYEIKKSRIPPPPPLSHTLPSFADHNNNMSSSSSPNSIQRLLSKLNCAKNTTYSSTARLSSIAEHTDTSVFWDETASQASGVPLLYRTPPSSSSKGVEQHSYGDIHDIIGNE